MTIIYNHIIPFKGYKCINLFGVLFVRSGKTMKDVDINHEAIHTAQMKETLYIGFYLLYFFEWLVKLIRYWNAHTAYRHISFEQEAYGNQSDLNYLKTREHFAWFWYRYL